MRQLLFVVDVALFTLLVRLLCGRDNNIGVADQAASQIIKLFVFGTDMIWAPEPLSASAYTLPATHTKN